MDAREAAPELAARYGTDRSPWRRRTLIGAVVVVAVAFCCWLGWAAWVHANPLVDSGNLRFHIVDDHTASATFTVELRHDDVRPTCTLIAKARDMSVVGELHFAPRIGSGGQVTQELRTERRAAVVSLAGCTAPGQTQPR